MENATKALLIAAAVLIVIVLIAIGMKIVDSSSGATDQVDSSIITTETSTFNNKFLAYVGTNKTRAQVLSLLNVAIANNSTNKGHQVTVNGEDPKTLVNDLAERTYTVSIDEYDSNGYITKISF